MADLLREVINTKTISELGERITGVYPDFDAAGFHRFITPNLAKLIKHVLRTLAKMGDPRALELLSFSSEFSVEVEDFSLGKREVHMGEYLEISLKLTSSEPAEQVLMIDYVINHMKANGSLRPKVLRWTEKTIAKRAPVEMRKRHPFREITTRNYYPGRQEIHIQINGKIVAQDEFFLVLS